MNDEATTPEHADAVLAAGESGRGAVPWPPAAWRHRPDVAGGSGPMGSSLARRTYLLFIVLAIVPIVVAGYVLVARMSDYMTQHVRDDLREESKRYGLMLFERMELADRALATLTNRTPEGIAAAMRDLASEGHGYFDVVSVRTPEGGGHVAGDLERLPYLACEAGPGRDSALDGQLRPAVDSRGRWSIALVRKQTVLLRPDTCVIGVLDADYLWRPDSLPQDAATTVVDPAGRRLLHFDVAGGDSDLVYPAAVVESRQRGGADSERIVGDWNLYLRNRFGVAGWNVSVSRDRATALSDIAAHRRAFSGAIFGGAVLLALLASITIRRSHRPLDELLGATRRIAGGDFSRPISSSDDPDLRVVGDAFNDMTTRLAQHFEALALLSSADQQILRSIGVDSVLQSVLGRAQSLLRAERVAVLLLDGDCPGAARLYSHSGDPNAPPALARHDIDEDALRALQEPDGASDLVVSDQRAWPCLQDFWSAGLKCCRIVPIRSGSVLHGAILVGYQATRPVVSDPPHLAASLADRLAVAITHAAREQELFYRGHYDSLTGLPNRALLRDRVEQAIGHAERSGSLLALLFLDLDRFKDVNDSMGHAVGDQLLQAVARRLTSTLPDAETVARLGGDEFVIVAGDLRSNLEVETLADRVLACFREPLDSVREGYVASTSIGLAVYPAHGATFDALLQHADTAMYVAKGDGGASCAVFEERMNVGAARRIDLETELRHALANDDFVLHYQPQVNLMNGKVHGAEALIRWRHPERGFVSPMDFIPVAEDSGLIVPIGDWVLREVCRQMAQWRIEGLSLQRVAVNLAVQQLLAQGFVDRVRELLEQYGLEPRHLELEVTESTLAKDMDRLAEVIWELADLGCFLAIDDFGTGYSSLSYLQKLPIQVLKIDRSFLPKSDADFGSMALCEAIIGIGVALGKSVVAEGVETYEQRDFLASRSCGIGQGYLFGRPMTAGDLSSFMGAPGKTQRFRRVASG